MTGSVQQEISLYDLWQILVKQKKAILYTWLLCIFIGVAYAFLATPIYKAESFLLPPSGKDLQPLNIQVLQSSVRSDRSVLASSYKSDKVYDLFVQDLKSRSNRRVFYEKHHIAKKLGITEGDDIDTFFEKNFNELLTVNRNVKKKEEAGFVSLSFEGEYPSLTAKIVNKFIEDVSTNLATNLVSEVNGKVGGLVRSIHEQIQGKKKVAKARREDRIVALQEALHISQALNEQDQSIKLGSVAVNTDEMPLYLLSPDALKAEIDVLKARKDDAPFIEGLRDLQEQLASLEGIKIEVNNVHPVFIDQKAIVPDEPEKPKKRLIVILSALLGLMLGVMIAFIKSAVVEKRDRKS